MTQSPMTATQELKLALFSLKYFLLIANAHTQFQSQSRITLPYTIKPKVSQEGA